jgi:hypothetical protein
VVPVAPSGAFFVGADFLGLSGIRSPPTWYVLTADAFGDKIPSYMVCPDRRRFRGYDPLLHHDFPVGGKLLPDIAEADTLFGDMIPSYITIFL